ncbi:VTC domain-containing protein [Actinomycetaceae bacterium MB13-C1-2]|nr:VTC domain-containing protein [Actinomycetaceae bacterium MB13-C1-2]
MIDTITRLQTISLEELNRIAELQRRVDCKYLVEVEEAREFPARLPSGSRILEINGETTSAYYSIYFDTPGWTLYSLAASKRRRRVKVRTRAYLDSGTGFLEIKTKGTRGMTEKVRIPHPVDRLAELSAADLDFIRVSLIAQGIDPDIADNLLPVTGVGYDRSTYVVPESPRERPARITIDTDIYWESLVTGRYFYPGALSLVECPSLAIIETKTERHSSRINRSLWRTGMRQTSISKYCTGSAALNPGLPSNKWHQSLMTIEEARG